MNNTATARPAGSRLALMVAAIFALLGSFVVPAQADYYGAGYYGNSYRPYPCSYRCGYPAYRYNYGCSSCGCYRCGYRPRVVYERRYIEREYVERRYGGYGGYGGYRRYYGCSPYRTYGGCGRPYGYYGGGYRPWGYGYGGIGRRWPAPYIGGYAQSGYEEPPRPPAPVWDEGDY